MSLADELTVSNTTPPAALAIHRPEREESTVLATWTVDKGAVYAIGSTHPTMLAPYGDGIPAALKARPNWVGWHLAPDASGKKLTKVPVALCNVSLQGYGPAASDDRGTWVSWEQCRHRWNRYRHLPAYRLDGIGFMFGPGKVSDGFIGIDLDKCRDRETGELSALAQQILDLLPGYWEVSPSGTGIKGVSAGVLPDGWDQHKAKGFPGGQEVEIYDRGRFFTVTGHRLPVCAVDVMPTGDRFADFLSQYFPAKTKRKAKAVAVAIQETARTSTSQQTSSGRLSDDEVISLLTTGAKNADRGAALWAGDTSGNGNDHSAADLALCNLLAFYCGGDAAQIDRLFRQSGLMREKWDERRGAQTYGERTIDEALAGRTDYYEPRHKAEPPAVGVEAPGDAPKRGVQIILDYFLTTYKPVFRRGNAIYTKTGETIPKGVACDVPTSPLITALSHAADAPCYAGAGGGVKWSALPGFFRTWVSVAWGDLLATLPDEDEAELRGESGESAREEFRQLVRQAMLTDVVLGESIGGSQITQTERRPLIDWCYKFATVGPWRDIRGKRCWCKARRTGDGGEMELLVAIRHELFSQLRADRRLCTMGANTFGRRAAKYGVGRTSRTERPHGQSAVVLDQDFVLDLIAGLCDDDTDEPGET